MSFLATLGEGLTNFYAFKLVRFCTLKLWNLTSARLIFDNLTTPVTSLYTAMVSAYASQPVHLSCTVTWISRKVVDEMSRKDVLTWTAMIFWYTRVGDITKAALLFEAMPDRDAAARRGWKVVILGLIVPRLFDCFRLVKCMEKCYCLTEARRVSDRQSKKCLALWNSLTNSFARHGQCENAISVFEEMMHYIYQLVDCLFTQKKVEQGLAYFDLITKTYWIEPGIEIYGFLIDLLMKIEPDDVVWGSLFDGIMLVNLYGELGKWDEVGKVRKIRIVADKQLRFFDKTHPRTEEICDALDNLAALN
ncbi:pentatricopeptide repeat-containing protein [Citrus sinensis]|nr:pentatricopeptide repeat-containing protein [Citrus sinensis]